MASSKKSSRKTSSNKKQKVKLVSIKKSPKKDKKLMATFEITKGKKSSQKTVHFGAKNYSDYTIHKDPERKQRYILRHQKNENWKDPTTAGALSLYVLWNKPSLHASISDFKKKFKL